MKAYAYVLNYNGHNEVVYVIAYTMKQAEYFLVQHIKKCYGMYVWFESFSTIDTLRNKHAIGDILGENTIL